ncbi:MAG: FG-GAP-like repeat-containing protein [Planctomycetota bacterium]|nr:FG-GAP-like repeat-containing protein [Planctomycetota bacterium]
MGIATTLSVAALATFYIARQLAVPSLADAESAFSHGNFVEALRVSELILQRQPESREALLLGGRAALAQQQHEVALALWSRVRADGSAESIMADVDCGALCAKLGRLSDAEQYFRRALASDPQQLDAHEQLLQLLRLEGRSWESLVHLHAVLRQKRFVVAHLELGGTLEATWINSDSDVPFLYYCGTVRPDDPLSLVGSLRLLLAQQRDVAVAREELTYLVASHPDVVEAQAMLGQLLFELGSGSEFLAWHSRLPDEAEQHPAIWVTRGRWVQGQGDTPGAVRCLWEALRRSPNDRAAHLLIAKLLVAIGQPEAAANFQRRGDQLLVFDDLLIRGPRGEDGRRLPATVIEMIKALENLGRLWEALGWSHILLRTGAASEFAQDTISRLEQRLNFDTPLTLDEANLAKTIDISNLPLPEWPAGLKSSGPATAQPGSAITFHDAARQVGLEFTYFRDNRRLRKRVYTFDFAGGGAAALDYDQDGWPDLYLTQSCSWPPGDSGQEPQNALFRNLDGKSFAPTTGLAGVGDQGFGHGPAIGDVNSDGFPDIYIANVGANRLYLNNGDGTFQDATHTSGTAGDEFSLSAAIADLNGDGLPDLYVANYLGGDALSRQCEGGGQPIQCSPLLFPGQQDRLYVNLGDDRFRDAALDAGMIPAEGAGKGMGVLAADIDGAGGLDLLVTNDTVANFLFINRTADGAIRMEELGHLAGVAYNELGHLQGSMGIAARDVNQDGMLDLFVTNFATERNNMFVQMPGESRGLFDERSVETNLGLTSTAMVGWGAQFLDAELDGDWDLLVANGHLDENTAGPLSGAMQPQFFENDGAARFAELPAAQLGPYFREPYFGRAVTRLDWNRDGLDDLCVTHLGAPTALLVNTSQRRGRFVALQLYGVSSNRDAIGAVVDVTTGDRHWTVQQMAGDGFEASNQRQIVVGLGNCDRVERLSIRWPNGSVQVFYDLAVDQEWMLVEDNQTPFNRSR